jgi:hypothetical protein
MAAPFATTAGVPATIAQRFRGVAITQRAAAWAVQAGKHTSLAGHWRQADAALASRSPISAVPPGALGSREARSAATAASTRAAASVSPR